ncbi:MAG: glycosyltransferase family 4 protein [Pseudomonadota bacterium]
MDQKQGGPVQAQMRAETGALVTEASTAEDETEPRVDETTPRVIVIHNGALRGYAIPAAFARAGMLERFYTDMCAGRGVGRVAQWGKHLPVIGPKLSRLAYRRPPPEVLAKTRTFDLTTAKGLIGEARTGSHHALLLARHAQWRRHGTRLCRLGFGRATHVFSVYGLGGPYLQHAKSAGLKVICDVNIAPSAGEIMRAEFDRSPGWEATPWSTLDPGLREEMQETADLFICPSDFVRQDVIATLGIPAEKTALVPYAVADKWFELETTPIPGRVLFVGQVSLRKGAHTLVDAAQQLRGRGRRYEFRFAGQASPHFLANPACEGLSFLQRVPREDIAAEFARADVLVLPSLAEGSAGVTYEALGAGVPVITTHEAGSVVRDGIDGLIVPSRDGGALAHAVERVVEDRALRTRMAAAARQRAQEFTWPRYAERLIEAVRRV